MGKSKSFLTEKITAAKDLDVPACTLKSHFCTPKNIQGRPGGLFLTAIRFSAPEMLNDKYVISVSYMTCWQALKLTESD